MNVLLTSAGRRNYLVDYFKQAVGPAGKVIVANSTDVASAAIVADRFYIAPLIKDKAYIPFLKELCARENVQLLLPLFDPELPLISQHKQEFEKLNVRVGISSEEVIDICFDKVRTVEFCRDNGIHAPPTFQDLRGALDALESNEITFPLILKPRWGTGSLATDVAADLDELEVLYKHLTWKLKSTYISEVNGAHRKNEILIQERIEGEEFGFDTVNDLEGVHCGCLARKKFGMRAGETDAAVTVIDSQMADVGRRIGMALRHIGILDADVIRDTRGDIYVLDLNPRFGGGYPFSHAAGANIPAAVIAWAEARNPDPVWLRSRADVISVKGININTKGT